MLTNDREWVRVIRIRITRGLVGFSELGLSDLGPDLIVFRDPALFIDLPQLHRDAQPCGGAPARQFYYHRCATKGLPFSCGVT